MIIQKEFDYKPNISCRAVKRRTVLMCEKNLIDRENGKNGKWIINYENI